MLTASESEKKDQVEKLELAGKIIGMAGVGGKKLGNRVASRPLTPSPAMFDFLYTIYYYY